MIIYEIDLSIEKSAAGEVSKWLPDQVKNTLANPGFIAGRLYRLNDSAENKLLWRIQFEIDNAISLEGYLAKTNQTLQDQAKDKFGSSVVVTPVVHDKIQLFTPPTAEGGLPLTDFPKLHCPFIRQTFDIDPGEWKKYGKPLGLREPKAYLAVNQINPGYEWVFDDPDTIAVEKLHGTNVKIRVESGRITAIQNRKNVVDPLMAAKGQPFLMEALFISAGRGLIPTDGTFAGEVIGPKLQSNPYKLDVHEWFPFDKSVTELRYKSFDEHERTYDNLSSWFKDHLHSRLFLKRARKQGSEEKVFAEGVVFYNLRRKAEQKTWMAKLRRDMFPWFYEPIQIKDFTVSGREQVEDQNQFD